MQWYSELIVFIGNALSPSCVLLANNSNTQKFVGSSRFRARTFESKNSPNQSEGGKAPTKRLIAPSRRIFDSSSLSLTITRYGCSGVMVACWPVEPEARVRFPATAFACSHSIGVLARAFDSIRPRENKAFGLALRQVRIPWSSGPALRQVREDLRSSGPALRQESKARLAARSSPILRGASMPPLALCGRAFDDFCIDRGDWYG